VAGFSNADRSKIDGNDVERRFGTSVKGRCRQGNDVVRAHILDQVGQDADRRRRAKGANDGHWHQLRREVKHVRQRTQNPRDQVHPARRAKHSHRGQHADKIRKNPEDDLDGFLGPDDELFVNGDFSQGGIEWEKKDEPRQHQLRERPHQP
jgi:hypothetical protein